MNSGSQFIQATIQENKNCFKFSFSKVTRNWTDKTFQARKTKKYIYERDNQNEFWKSRLQTDSFTVKWPQMFDLQN